MASDHQPKGEEKDKRKNIKKCFLKIPH